MKKIALFLLLSFLYGMAFGQDYLQIAEDYFAQGNYELAKGNYENYKLYVGDSMQYIDNQMKKCVHCIDILAIANMWRAEGNYPQARLMYYDVLKINPLDTAMRQHIEKTKEEEMQRREDAKIFNSRDVDKQAEFPGGPEELNKFLKDNLKYPQVAKDLALEGVVVLKILIDKTGRISPTDVVVILSTSIIFDEEAIRLVKSMPNWIPAQKDGKNVSTYFTLPIQCKLTDN
ncbi:energy transducer TonB [Bacteroidales bacterium OttesenSCG-928-B11]|nr:energy transducer TonB [Bacteroidales bacterium OttesenSCG-928-C03]MDL2311875.1 energy transducer TonB [Bacteroidales bacterium OttesenSCG-928-B11]MDL2326168.1 energy transducer TonB [Bacteroidales bacterium OttesenSCG-928-A14]